MPAIRKRNKARITRTYLFYRVVFVTVLLLVLPVLIWAVKNPRQILNQFASQQQDIDATKTTYNVDAMVIMFLPDENNDGIIDADKTDYTGTYSEYFHKNYDNTVNGLRSHIMDDARALAELSTRATKYHGYKDPNAVPAIQYSIREGMIYEEKNSPPPGKLAWFNGPDRNPDYVKILNKYNICDAVDNKGIKEVWMWTQHAHGIVPDESNFSSKLSGDISNSARYADDLPLCNKSYTLYNFNFTRHIGEALHNRGHQLEHLFNEWPNRNNLSQSQWPSLLFWGRYVGSEYDHEIHRPGCGWIHEPPNVPVDPNSAYIYNSTNVRQSDCEDWKPDGSGVKTNVSCSNWMLPLYGRSDCSGDAQTAFEVWWMQNLPGYGNPLYDTNGKKLRNWWDYMGNFDNLYKQGTFLYLPVSNPGDDTISPTINISSPAEGSTLSGTVNVTINASDNMGVTSLKILFDNTGNAIYTAKDCGAATTCTYALNVNTLDLKADEKPDNFVIVGEARDAKGNLGRKFIEVKAQKTTPPPSNTQPVGPSNMLSPTNNSTISAPLNFRWEQSSNASEYHLYLGSAAGSKDYYTKRYTSATTSVSLATSDLLTTVANNSTIYVRLWTNTGSITQTNWSYKDYTYRYSGTTTPPPNDTTAPTVDILSPAKDSTVSGVVTVQTSASDNVAVTSHKILFDNTGNAIYTAKDCGAATSCSYTLDVNQLDLKQDERPEYFVIVVEARDAKNNLGRKYIEVKAQKTTTPPATDTTPPTVTISNPSNGATVSGSINIAVSASDSSGISSLTIFIDGSPVKACGAVTSCSLPWESSITTNGSHVIKAEARDTKNNTGLVTITVNVSNSTPTTTADITPAPGSTISIPTTFEWKAYENASYAVMFGSYKGGSNFGTYYMVNNKLQYSNTAVTSGTTLYVRLIRYSGRTVTYNDYQYNVR